MYGEAKPEPDQPVLLVEQFPSVPPNERLQELVRILGGHGARTTYLLFLEQDEDIARLGNLTLPENMRLAVSIRSVAARELAHYYREVDVQYDQSAASIDYLSAVGMAMAQLAGDSVSPSPYRLSEWTPGKAYLGLFDDVVNSNAEAQAKAALIRNFYSASSNPTLNWTETTGVVVAPEFWSTGPTDIDAVLAGLHRDNCGGDYPWDGLIHNGIAFQAFGQILD